MENLSGFWQELTFTLIAEVIDILITVFLVDRLIKRSEERRWEPVENVVWAELLKATDRLLLTLTPPTYAPPMQRCYFGNIEVKVSVYEYSDEKLFENIWQWLLNFRDTSSIREEIDAYKQRKDQLIIIISFNPKSEVVRQLVEIDQDLQILLYLIDLKKGGDKDIQEIYISIKAALKHIFSLHQWLIQHATKILN